MTDFNQMDMQRNTTPDADRKELLRLLREKQRRQSGISSAPLPRPRLGPLPVSEVQERLWAQQGLGEGAAWTVAGALDLIGALDVGALRSALNALVARHEPLRTRFVGGPDGVPQQVIDNPAGAAFQVRAGNRSQVNDLVRTHEEEEFDLEQGPLFRVLLIELDAKEYVLSLAMHHIIADGWSIDVLVRDMRELYRAALEGGASSLVSLDIQYADWAAWQWERDLSRSLEYWKQSLADPPPPLALGRVVASRARGEAQQVERPVPRYLAEALVSYARDRRASLFMVLLTGWALAMYRRTRASDLLLGTTVAGREQVELEPLIGFFVNIIALRLDLNGDPSGDELMDHVRGAVVDGFLHQGVPFERLLAEVEGLRQPCGRSPVPVMVRHQNYRQADIRTWAGNVTACAFSGGRTREAATDLDVQYFGQGTDLTVTVEYDACRFDAREVETLLDDVEMVLSRLVAEPGARLSRLIRLTAEEQRAQEALLQGPKRVWSAENILELFAKQVAERPHAVACRLGERLLTYDQLERRSNQVAGGLSRRGVIPGDRVVLYLPRGVDLLAILLGVWKTGAVYVPVDPNYPVVWAARIVDEAEPRVIIVETEAEELRFDKDGAEIVTSHALWREEEEQSPQRSGPKSGDLAYISYTSGSTGRPKGVQIEHRQLINCLRNLWEAQPFVPDDVVAQKTATGFVVHLKEMLAGLLVGVEQWIAPDDLVRNIPAFARALAEHRVTRLNLVPSQLAALLDHAEHLGGLRLVITAGEPLPELLRMRFERLLPNTHLYNNYGCTELNDITYYHAAGPGVQKESGTEVPMGNSIANTQLHLLDELLHPVLPGVTAELWVEGAAVGAHGYHHWPELTAERWKTKPGDKNGTRLFRTGDLARLSRAMDGSLHLEYCGRADFQVKLRGQKVDPLAIEQVLAEHPGLSEVAVRGWNSGAPDALLAAYYVLRPETAWNSSDAAVLKEAKPDRNRLYRWLQERLPAYMVPSAWVQLDALPLLPNGKLNRGALPHPEISSVSDQQSPRGDRERALAELWAQVLHLPLDRVGREDNFFSIGGNSMLAVQLVERMRAQGWVANVQMLFDGSTLKDLAAATADGDAYFAVPPNRIPDSCEVIRPEMLTLVNLNEAEIASISRQISGGPSNIQDIYPLAPLQEGLLFHYLANTTGDPYLLNSMLAVKSREDALALLDALQSVVDRHDILRTAVLWKDVSEPVQVVLRRVVMPVEEIEISSATTGAVQYLKERFDPRQYRMDIDVAPLLRACLARDEEHDRWIVLLLFHHLITDRVSLELVHREIGAHLRGQSEGLPPALPYRNFVAQARLGANRTEQENFFRKMLGDFDEPTRPFGISGMPNGTICETSRPVEARLAARLREQARSLGVTVASLFHLAWAYVLAETSGNDDVVFGTTLSGRMHAGAGADQVMGLFVNTLPIRIRLGHEDALTEVRQVNQTLSALLSHEQTPLALAQRCSGISAPHPLFLAVLNYRHYRQSEMDGLERPFPIEFLAARDGGAHPLTLAVDDTENGFVLRTIVVTNLDAERMCDYMRHSLEQLAEVLEKEKSEN